MLNKESPSKNSMYFLNSLRISAYQPETSSIKYSIADFKSWETFHYVWYRYAAKGLTHKYEFLFSDDSETKDKKDEEVLF